MGSIIFLKQQKGHRPSLYFLLFYKKKLKAFVNTEVQYDCRNAGFSDIFTFLL